LVGGFSSVCRDGEISEMVLMGSATVVATVADPRGAAEIPGCEVGGDGAEGPAGGPYRAALNIQSMTAARKPVRR
jgi:hypothetical protein